MTGCLNGGSCLSNEKKQTYSCMCKKPWTGVKCEVKIGKKCFTLHESSTVVHLRCKHYKFKKNQHNNTLPG